MPGTHILVVEDDEDTLELLRYHLAREGYTVTTARCGEDALQAAERGVPDIVVLDLMLPGLDGLDVCRALKRDPKTVGVSVVIVTAKGEESDVVAGLELGADDYVAKPFSVKVLVARLRAVLRRRQDCETDADAPVRVRELEINLGRHEVLVKGQAVRMTFMELRILHFLARRPGWVRTREQIVEAVRTVDHVVTARAIDVQVVGIRRKLGPCAQYVETVRGVGYRVKP